MEGWQEKAVKWSKEASKKRMWSPRRFTGVSLGAGKGVRRERRKNAEGWNGERRLLFRGGRKREEGGGERNATFYDGEAEGVSSGLASKGKGSVAAFEAERVDAR